MATTTRKTKSAAPAKKPKAAPKAKAKASAESTSSKKPAAPKSDPPAKAKKNDDALYTDPALRHRLKEKIQAEDKGGKAGQWSARKAQLLAAEYEKEGGGYKKSGRAPKQQHLEKWTEEKWQTADGKKAVRGKTTARYLPKKAWDELSPAEKKATDEKKKTASRTGKQFVDNTEAAKKARKNST